MSTTHTARSFLARHSGTFLNYLHIDLAIAGLALAFLLTSGFATNLPTFFNVRSQMPGSSAEHQAQAPNLDAEAAPQRLLPAMAVALEHVAQRYRVSPDALQPIFAAAQAAGREFRLDPLLIVAVISIESRFNPYSQSSMGAQGLMQIIPRFHQEKLPKEAGSLAFLDPVINVQLGARILQEAIQRQGGLMEGLQYYAGAIDDAERSYANKVLAEKSRLEQAPRR